MKRLILALAALLLAGSAGTALAGNQAGPTTETSITLLNPLGSTSDIAGVINNIIRWLTTAGSAIAALMIIVGGIQILVSGGVPEKFERGKKTIIYTAIGYGIIVVGSGIIDIVKKILSG